MQADIKIIKLTIPADAPIGKGLSNSGRKCFYVRGTYTLADGQTLSHRVTAERKKNLPDTIKREIEAVESGAVSLSASGCIVTHYRIGSRGLVPDPDRSDAATVPSADAQASAGTTRKGVTFGEALAASNATNGMFGLEEPHASEARRLLASAGAS